MAVFCFPAFLISPDGREMETLVNSGASAQILALRFPTLFPNADAGAIKSLCADELSNQQFTYLYSCELFRARQQNGAKVSAIVGVSMGLYAALVAAGSITVEVGLCLVDKAFQLASASVVDIPCAMVSVIGLSFTDISRLMVRKGGHDNLSVVNCNGEVSFLIAGRQVEVSRFAEASRNEGAIKVNMLNVTAPYHTQLLAGSIAEFENVVNSIEIAAPSCPIYSSVDGIRIDTAMAVRRELVRNLTTPLQWARTMQNLIELGYKKFFECGPGTDLYRISKFIPGEYTFRPFYRFD